VKKHNPSLPATKLQPIVDSGISNAAIFSSVCGRVACGERAGVAVDVVAEDMEISK
jgi:hypothetical protein